MARRPCGQPAARRDSRVEAGGDVERAVIGAGGDPDRIAVAQVANDVVRGPAGTPRRRSPVVGTKSPEDRDEPLPLLTEHLKKVLWVELARARGPQEQRARLDLSWPWAVINHRCLLGLVHGRVCGSAGGWATALESSEVPAGRLIRGHAILAVHRVLLRVRSYPLVIRLSARGASWRMRLVRGCAT